MICRKCGSTEDVEYYTLMRSYETALCLDCVNNWHEYGLNLDIHKRRMLLKATKRYYNLKKVNITLEDYLELEKELLEMDIIIFKVAENWIKENGNIT